MTLPIGNRTDATGNNSTPNYSYSFRILAESHLLVTVRHPTTGVETTLALTTDYTVSGVGNVSGGAIALVAGKAWMTAGNLTTGWHITMRGVEPLAQETDIRNQGDYYPEGIEDQFDYQMRIAQQQQDEIDRSVKLPETVAASGFDTTLPADIASNPDSVIIVNPTGTGLAMGPTGPQISGAQSAATAAIAAQGAAEDAQGLAEAAKVLAEAAASTMTLASQAEAEAGTDNTKYMSAKRVAEAIAAQAAGAGYTLTFDNADLVLGVLTVTHGLNTTAISVTVRDNNGKVVLPDDDDATDVNTATISLASYSLGLTTAWVTSTAYVVGDCRTEAGVTYRCLVSHTSGTFATDLAAGKWTTTPVITGDWTVVVK